MYRKITLAFLLFFALIFAAQPAAAGDVILSNNNGDANGIWFIQGEPSLVMNGFDLTSLGLTFPVVMDAVTISVVTPVPGVPIDLVVYEDADGGPPGNATLAGRTQVFINEAGEIRIPLEPPIAISQPVVWVGFYLPVDFQFQADRSGASVLTYWAWAPGGTLDLNNIGAAPVLGPADGTAPVNINMEGVARITAELRTTLSSFETAETLPLGVQVVDETGQDLSVMQQYEFCGELYFDKEDIRISGADNFDLHCRVGTEATAPTGIIPNTNFERRGFLYDVFAFGGYQRVESDSEWLVIPVTHCIRPNANDLAQAVIGVAYGAPREWRILPSVRFGELVCAEIPNTGNIAYFVPRTGAETTENSNMLFSNEPTISPHPLECGKTATITVRVINNGSEATSVSTQLIIQDVLVRTEQITKDAVAPIPVIRPGETVVIKTTITINTFRNELHRLVMILDQRNLVAELNELDNSATSEYILQKGVCP